LIICPSDFMHTATALSPASLLKAGVHGFSTHSTLGASTCIRPLPPGSTQASKAPLWHHPSPHRAEIADPLPDACKLRRCFNCSLTTPTCLWRQLLQSRPVAHAWRSAARLVSKSLCAHTAVADRPQRLRAGPRDPAAEHFHFGCISGVRLSAGLVAVAPWWRCRVAV
jgi:hypothetical protein